MRKRVMGGAAVGLVGALVVAGAALAQAPTPAGADRPVSTKAQVAGWMKTMSTWGTWGKDDQLGSLNYVTPEKRRQAAALVRTGQVVSMEQPVILKARHEEIAKDGRPNGVGFYEITFRTFPKGDPRQNDDYTSDLQTFAPHGSGLTHLDALCHYSNGDGQLYNGFPLTETVRPDVGCTRLGLDTLKEGIVTRGIIIDMTRLRAARVSSTRVFVEDIEAFERQAGITVSPGDALFVYDPRQGRGAAGVGGGSGAAIGGGGIDPSVMPWMARRGVTLTSGIASATDDRHAGHRLPLVAAGIFLLDGPNLAPLAETAARLNRWEFMFTMAPPLVPGSSGYPVNPLALF